MSVSIRVPLVPDPSYHLNSYGPESALFTTAVISPSPDPPLQVVGCTSMVISASTASIPLPTVKVSVSDTHPVTLCVTVKV